MQELTCPDMIHGKILSNENKIIDLSQSDKNFGNVHKWRLTGFLAILDPTIYLPCPTNFQTIKSYFGDHFESPYLPYNRT